MDHRTRAVDVAMVVLALVLVLALLARSHLDYCPTRIADTKGNWWACLCEPEQCSILVSRAHGSGVRMVFQTGCLHSGTQGTPLRLIQQLAEVLGGMLLQEEESMVLQAQVLGCPPPFFNFCVKQKIL